MPTPFTARPASARRRAHALMAATAGLLLLPAWAGAQERVYELSELTTQPRLASPTRTAQLFQSSYPSKLKAQGIGGFVQLEVVVAPSGKVEVGSADAVASVAALADAAKAVAEQLEFVPAKVKDQPVRARVVLPVVYKP